MANHKLRPFLTADQIQTRIHEMGAEISRDYGPAPVLLLGILKGSFIFMADLARSITVSTHVEFISVSSYGKNKSSSGQVRLTKDLDISIEGLDVLIVEDILDTGITLTYIMSLLEQRRPKSIRIATLLNKPERRLRPVEAKYIGFDIPDEFVVGYGLDYAEDYRNLPDVCILEN